MYNYSLIFYTDCNNTISIYTIYQYFLYVNKNYNTTTLLFGGNEGNGLNNRFK